VIHYIHALAVDAFVLCVQDTAIVIVILLLLSKYLCLLRIMVLSVLGIFRQLGSLLMI